MEGFGQYHLDSNQVILTSGETGEDTNPFFYRTTSQSMAKVKIESICLNEWGKER